MAYGQAFVATDMPNTTIWYGYVTVANSRKIVIDDGYRKAVYKGEFDYDFLGRVSGTLDSIKEFAGATKLYQLDNVGANARAMYKAIQIEADFQKAAKIALAKNDKLFGSDFNDNIKSFAGNDLIKGRGGDDIANGGKGNDKLVGGIGDDELYGSSGKDRLKGGSGQDEIHGGKGKDLLTGGADADIFVFGNFRESKAGGKTRDVVTDFTQGSDLFDLAGIDAGTGFGDQAFAFLGASGFSGAGAELNYRQVSEKNITIVEGDIDGDGVADFQIELSGMIDLGVGDFIL